MRLKAELNFPSKLKDEPILCQVCKQFDIIVSILEASFTTDVGWAILIFEGEKQELQKALSYLSAKGIEIDIQQEGNG